MLVRQAAIEWLLLAVLVVNTGAQNTIPSKQQLFRVSLPTTEQRQQFGNVIRLSDEFDAIVWKLEGTHAEVFATDATVERLRVELSHPEPTQPRLLVQHDGPIDGAVAIEKMPVDPDEMLVQQFEQRHDCSSRTLGYLDALAQQRTSRSPSYTSSAFFDCWRSGDEIDVFLAALAELHPQFLARLPSITVSAEHRDIPAYRLSVGVVQSDFTSSNATKEVIYVQGVAHAREWQSGSSVAFTIVAMLDGLLANDSAVLSAVQSFDWFFVPVLNVDGYRYSLERPETRFWRKNRRRVTSARSGRVTIGADLNRNFPAPFNATVSSNSNGGPSSDTYAGPSPLSEPETAGLDRWLRSLRLRGVLDFHAFGGQVLRPPGSNELLKDIADESDALRRIKRLGDAVRDAMPVAYESRAASELYASSGSLMDALFFGRQDSNIAALTIELAGDSFVVDARTIRPVGAHALSAALAFARELPGFYNTSSK